MLHQLIGILPVLRTDRDADRGGNGEMMSPDIHALLEADANLLGDPERCGAVGAGAKDDEFVTPETRDMAAPFQQGGKPLHHRHQQRVADHMAERIVNILEAIEIHPQDSQRILLILIGIEQFAQAHLHRHAVFHAGQIVISRQPLIFGGKQRFFLLAPQRLHDNPVGGAGDFRHGEHHRDQHDGKDSVSDIAIQPQPQCSRQQGKAGLSDGDFGTPRIAPGYAGGIACRQRDREDVDRCIFKPYQRNEGQRAQHARIDPCAQLIRHFPAAIGATPPALQLTIIENGGGGARDRDQADDCGADNHHRVAGNTRDGEAQHQSRKGSDRERGWRRIETLNQRTAKIRFPQLLTDHSFQQFSPQLSQAHLPSGLPP